MKRRLAIDSGDFLQKYTLPLFIREIGHPLVILRMKDDMERTCPFVSAQGCSIYSDRPWSCRSFPLEPFCHASDKKSETTFTLMDTIPCLGLAQDKRTTVKKWRESQKVSYYEEMNRLWAEVTQGMGMNVVKILDEKQQELFYMASYDLDRFRDLTCNQGLLQPYRLSKKILKRIKNDDVELMKLSFRWLRAVLFGEKTLIESKG